MADDLSVEHLGLKEVEDCPLLAGSVLLGVGGAERSKTQSLLSRRSQCSGGAY